MINIKELNVGDIIYFWGAKKGYFIIYSIEMYSPYEGWFRAKFSKDLCNWDERYEYNSSGHVLANSEIVTNELKTFYNNFLFMDF